MYALILTVNKLISYYLQTLMSALDWVYLDAIVSLLVAVSLSWAKPDGRLHPSRPTSSLLSLVHLASYATQVPLPPTIARDGRVLRLQTVMRGEGLTAFAEAPHAKGSAKRVIGLCRIGCLQTLDSVTAVVVLVAKLQLQLWASDLTLCDNPIGPCLRG